MKLPLVVCGASGHAKVVADIVHLQAAYDIVGFVDNVNPEPRPVSFDSASVLGGFEALNTLFESGVRHLIVGFGDCLERLKMARLARHKGFTLATVIHPSAVIAQNVFIGSGTVVTAGAVINSGVTIGDNVIINTNSSVDHDCRIAKGVHISPGVTVAGHVTVHAAVWIGIGATVVDHVQIGAESIIGAGSVVLTDIPSRCVAFGVPARVVRSL